MSVTLSTSVTDHACAPVTRTFAAFVEVERQEFDGSVRCWLTSAVLGLCVFGCSARVDSVVSRQAHVRLAMSVRGSKRDEAKLEGAGYVWRLT